MASDWVDCIVATRTKAGRYAIYARKWAEEYVRRRYVRVWREIDAEKGIKTAQEFLVALRRCQETLSVELDPVDVVRALSGLNV